MIELIKLSVSLHTSSGRVEIDLENQSIIQVLHNQILLSSSILLMMGARIPHIVPDQGMNGPEWVLYYTIPWFKNNLLTKFTTVNHVIYSTFAKCLQGK